jgi:hypothetical protein
MVLGILKNNVHPNKFLRWINNLQQKMKINDWLKKNHDPYIFGYSKTIYSGTSQKF